MEKRILMIGIGIGLIISSCIFYIPYTVMRNNEKRQEQLNLFATNDTDKVDETSLIDIINNENISEQQLDEINIEVEQMPENFLDSIDKSQIAIEEDVEIAEDLTLVEEVTQAADEPLEDETKEEVEYIKFRITEGSSSGIIIDNLYSFGLIDDKESFDDYLTEKDVKTKLRYGVFNIPIGSSYEEIVSTLLNVN